MVYMIRKLIWGISFFILLHLLVLLSGCNTGESFGDVTETTSNSDTYFSSYYCYESHPGFDEFVLMNGIDSAYVEDQKHVKTENEMEDCEKKYISIWKNELSLTLNELQGLMSDYRWGEVQGAFEDLENNMQCLWSFEYSIRNTQLEGSSVLFHRLFEEKEWYRNHTIRMKYLVYCEKRNTGETDPEVVWHTHFE